MKKMTIERFKKQCVTAIAELQETGDILIITKKGKAIAQLTAIRPQKKGDIFDFMKGKGRITGDIISPALSPEEWGDLY